MGAWRIGVLSGALAGLTASPTAAHLDTLSIPTPSTPSVSAAATPQPKAKRRYQVAAMGDSLTDPRSHGGKYLEYLAAKCPESRFDSYGVGGNMVNQMRKRFAHDILKTDAEAPRPYSHVIILGGINDICSDESASRTNDKIKDDLTAMYKLARDHGLTVIAVTLPPWGGFTKYYNRRRARSTFDLNDWIRQQGRDATVDAVVDIFPVLSCGDPEFLCEPYSWPDRVHWSKKGHLVVGDFLLSQVFSDCR